jgi:sulfur carrier protein
MFVPTMPTNSMPPSARRAVACFFGSDRMTPQTFRSLGLSPVVSRNVEIVCNGQSHQIAEGTTVADLLVALKLSPRQVAVEVNLDLVPRGKHAEHPLKAGDRVEVVTLVGGG